MTTSAVGRQKISPNIDSRPAEESMVDQVVGKMSFSASTMLVTCFVFSVTSLFAVAS
jgi:hypothetical protein